MPLIVTRPVPARRSTPWRTAFSTSGWTDIAGTTTSRVSGGMSNEHVEAVPEPRLLEAEVTLDVVELLAQRHVRAAVTEQVARELGEVDQQLAGLVGPGMDVAGHGGQRVVDEVRGDLSPQRAQLGVGQALLLLGQDRERDLGRDQAGRLGDHAQLGLAGATR